MKCSRRIRFSIRLACCGALLVLLAPQLAAQRTHADEFADRQDFGATPPTLSGALGDILWFVRPNGYYDSWGPPFASPRPPLPAHVAYVNADCSSGSYQTSTNPRCVTTWSKCWVWLKFDDGSDYTYLQEGHSERCSDGSSSSFLHTVQVADAGPPGNVDDVTRVQSYTRDNLVLRRKASHTAGAGRDIAFVAALSRPLVSGGDLAITIGPGGVLDLRQNSAAGGPLFVTDGPALLRCDSILMDPGVVLTDLFSLPPIVVPADLIVEDNSVIPNFVAVDDHSPTAVPIALVNSGSLPDTVTISWVDTLGWMPPGQIQIGTLPGGVALQNLTVQVPPGTPPGALDVVTVQMGSAADPSQQRTAVVRVVHDPAGIARFGAGTPSCAGAHTVDVDRALTAGGGPMHLTCTNAAPGALSVWMLGETIGGNYGTLQIAGLAAELYVDPTASLFVTLYAFADSSGSFQASVQLPANPSLRGMVVAAQGLSLWPSSCATGPEISSSPGLQLVVQ